MKVEGKKCPNCGGTEIIVDSVNVMGQYAVCGCRKCDRSFRLGFVWVEQTAPIMG